jgi:hypothetical protein
VSVQDRSGVLPCMLLLLSGVLVTQAAAGHGRYKLCCCNRTWRLGPDPRCKHTHNEYQLHEEADEAHDHEANSCLGADLVELCGAGHRQRHSRKGPVSSGAVLSTNSRFIVPGICGRPWAAGRSAGALDAAKIAGQTGCSSSKGCTLENSSDPSSAFPFVLPVSTHPCGRAWCSASPASRCSCQTP